MTNIEALENLKSIYEEVTAYDEAVCYVTSEDKECIESAINALEKQIAKKILYRKQNYGTPWLCCECEADQAPTEFFSTDGSEPKEKHTFCWMCGQKLDWGEQNERD